MFWLQRKIWLELFGLIIIASTVSVFAWATTDTPGELELKVKSMEYRIALKDEKLEWLEDEKIEPLLDFRKCISFASRLSAKREKDFWALRVAPPTGANTLQNRRYEFLRMSIQKCFTDVE